MVNKKSLVCSNDKFVEFTHFASLFSGVEEILVKLYIPSKEGKRTHLSTILWQNQSRDCWFTYLNHFDWRSTLFI